MTKKAKILELTNQIIELKKLSNTMDTKKTIQRLQQEMNKLISNDS